jgi:hypothetical protein
MVYAVIVPEPLLATYAKLPEGSTVTELGEKLVGNGEPATTDKIPVLVSIE